MDFELTEEQKDIQQAARGFAAGEFDKEKILEWEQAHTFPRELWKKACKLGFVGIHYPEEYGGQGYGIFENILIVEEFCRKDSGVGIALSLVDFSSEIILHFGTLEQKKRVLIPVAGGEAISAGERITVQSDRPPRLACRPRNRPCPTTRSLPASIPA